MSETSSQSWDDAVDALRRAARELRDAIGHEETPSTDATAAASRLKDDVSRLERSASDLVTKLSSSLDQQRGEIESSFDRERAERMTGQLKTSLEEFGSLARALTADVAAATESSLKQADPEIKTAIRALDDVINSAVSWIRATIDPVRDQRGGLTSEGRPPLDDL